MDCDLGNLLQWKIIAMNGGDPQSNDESRPSETLEDNTPPIEEKAEPSDGAESSDALARAISSMLGSVIKDFDHRAENASKSQDELSSAIDRLTRGTLRFRMIRVLFLFCVSLFWVSLLNLISFSIVFFFFFLLKMVNSVSSFWPFGFRGCFWLWDLKCVCMVCFNLGECLSFSIDLCWSLRLDEQWPPKCQQGGNCYLMQLHAVFL